MKWGKSHVLLGVVRRGMPCLIVFMYKAIC